MAALKNRTSRRRCHSKSATCVLGTTLMHFATGSGATLPPVADESISKSDTSWRATSEPSEEFTMGALKAKFETRTLSEVMNATKVGAIQHAGDAGGSVCWLCYTSVASGYRARVWIEASGEMGGGPENRITAVAVRRLTNDRLPSDCPRLPQQFEPLSFGNGIWLGAVKATVERTFPGTASYKGTQAFVGYREGFGK